MKFDRVTCDKCGKEMGANWLTRHQKTCKGVDRETGKTEIVYVLDETGSMNRIRHDTIGGFNSFLREQKAVPGEATVSLRMFSSFSGDKKVRSIYDGRAIANAPELTAASYRPRGMTPLLDAVGVTIKEVELRLEKSGEKPLVIFVVMTDGLENDSREYDAKTIKRMVETKVDHFGWKFVFLGANMDAWAVGTGMGMQDMGTQTFEATPLGVKKAYSMTTSQVTNLRVTRGEYKDWDKISTDGS